MNDHANLLEMMNTAMQAQRRSVRAYEIMANAAVGVKDKEILHTIRREERRHYYLLEGIYEDLTGQAAAVSRPALSMPKYFPDMLKTAICDKLEVVDHLELMRGEMNCVRQRDLLDIIISDQKEHARILAAIFNRQ